MLTILDVALGDAPLLELPATFRSSLCLQLLEILEESLLLEICLDLDLSLSLVDLETLESVNDSFF